MTKRKEEIEKKKKKYLREKRKEWLRGKKRIVWREKGRKEPATALKRNVDDSAEVGGMELSWADGGLHPATDSAETSSPHLGQL